MKTYEEIKQNYKNIYELYYLENDEPKALFTNNVIELIESLKKKYNQGAENNDIRTLSIFDENGDNVTRQIFKDFGLNITSFPFKWATTNKDFSYSVICENPREGRYLELQFYDERDATTFYNISISYDETDNVDNNTYLFYLNEFEPLLIARYEKQGGEIYEEN